MRFKPLLLVLSILSLFLAMAGFNGNVAAQNVSNTAMARQTQAEELVYTVLDRMSPLEKAGQLMLITFDGTDTTEASQIYKLIQEYHIGGVVLSTARNNFVSTDPAEATRSLIDSLQNIAYQKSIPSEEEAPAGTTLPAYVPLYIAFQQYAEDDYSKILLPGLKNLPSEMTIGATWSPELADAMGQVYGLQLSQIGFNLFFGPNLDLIDTGDSNRSVFTSTNSFGANPYWVGELGRAFISGLHKGSENRLSVIATHFPGIGSADRSIGEEVSTIQRSLEQLKQKELAPFLRVTSPKNGENGQVDGVMVSHIRYQGLQGNVRSTTRPISFDQVALQQLLSQPPMNSWRLDGGLVVSDNLGSPAIRNFFDPTGITFDPLSITRIAFLAGNDMLFLDNFAASTYEEQAETIQRVITFFAQKYQEDSVFAQRVDESVARILQNKLKLYGEFDPKNILSSQVPLEEISDFNQLSLEVARESITMLSPDEAYFNALINEGPKPYDYITVFNDTRQVQPCEDCPRLNILGINDFKDTMLSLYGPQGANQIADYHISSYTFAQLTQFLDNAQEQNAPYLIDHVKRSRWIIFNVLSPDPEYPSSYALQRLLAENSTLLRDKIVLVFAYDTPFFLDSTEVSKITAFYGLFTPSKASLELASRVLMYETRPKSSLPFSLPAVAYDLEQQLTPDPNQIINLALISSLDQTGDAEPPIILESPSVDGQQTTPAPLFRLGEAVNIQAGPILDRNGNIVPDGTKAQFTIQLAGESLILSLPDATTVDGYASIEYRVEREGIFAVTVRSGEAKTSATLILTTQGGLAEIVLPTPTPPEQIETPEPSPTPEPTSTPDLPPTTEANPSSHPSGFPKLNDWLLVVMLLITGFGLSYGIAHLWWKRRIWAVRAGLCTVLGGMIAYILLSVGFPSLVEIVRQSGTWFVVQMSFVGMLFGWIAAMIWWLSDQAKLRKLDIPD